MECIKCQSQLDDNAKFCPFCGEVQKLEPCDNCGTMPDKGFKFCQECGYPLNNKKYILEKSNKKENNKFNPKENIEKDKNSLYTWLTLSIKSFVLLILICLSFIPIGKAGFNDLTLLGDPSDMPTSIKLDYSIIDSFQVITYINEHNDYNDLSEYYLEILTENVDEDILKVDEYDDLTNYQKRQVDKAFKKINPFYSYSIEEVREISKVSITVIIIIDVLYLASIITLLIFLILSIINLCTKRKTKNTNRVSLWMFIITLILFVCANYFNKISVFTLGSGPILMIIISSLNFIGINIYTILYDKIDMKPKFIIKKSVIILCLCLAAILISSSGLKYRYTYDNQMNKKSIVVDSEPINKYIINFNFLLYPDANLEEISFINKVNSVLTGNTNKESYYTVKIMNSSTNYLANKIQQMSVNNYMIATTLILHILCLAVFIILIKKNLNDFIINKEKAKKHNNIFLPIFFALWVGVIVLLIILTATLNITFDILKYSQLYKASISFGFYLLPFILIFTFIWNIVFKVNKKEYELN